MLLGGEGGFFLFLLGQEIARFVHGQREWVSLFVIVVLLLTVAVAGGLPLVLTATTRVTIDRSQLRLQSIFRDRVVSLRDIVRLSAFDSYRQRTYMIELRDGSAVKLEWPIRDVLGWGARYREAANRTLDEVTRAIELRTGLHWIGVDRSASVSILQLFRHLRTVAPDGRVGRWIAAHALWRDPLLTGLNDPLIRWGYYVMTAVVGIAFAFILTLSSREILTPLFWLTAAFLVVAWCGLSAGTNAIFALIRQQLRTREAIESRLIAARLVQQQLLPTELPQIPGYDIAASYAAAEELGGDYYDVVPTRGGFAIVIADVAGKGLSAGLLMTLTKGALKARIDAGDSLVEAQAALNRIIRDSSRRTLVTLAAAEVNGRNGEVIVVRAGHTPPLLARGSGEMQWITPVGVALGMPGQPKLEAVRIALMSGDRLIFYTDGVTEMMNSAGEMFGEDGLLTIVRSSGDHSAEALQRDIVKQLENFCGGAPPNDDVTVVVLRRT